MEKSIKDKTQVSAWGLLAVINLYNCDPDLIREPAVIKQFIIELCQVINMTRFGDVLIERFGKDSLKGYSVMQFIETSSITAHFDEADNRAFIDIFSCKSFEVKPAVDFCFNCFKAKNFKCEVIVRK